MFSKVLATVVKLTGIFLILYISATSATPTAQPGEVQKINEDIHARVAPYHPHNCLYPYAWLRRECLGYRGPAAWQDVCAWSGYATNFHTHYDNKQGTCPDGTVCLDVIDPDNKHVIFCTSEGKKKGKRKKDPQVGTSDAKRARNEIGNIQVQFTAKIDHDMAGASVAAVLESECRPINDHCHICFFAHVGNLFTVI